ncbi:GntR family transcriptional regulator [Paramicrobacterium agarici]|uniref:GntR family transcriptional regulator n=1 Tax=Paramicrobacterium agarici TaxID=630514 RepID=UPI00115405E4|nr:GntR family transcriptional regulator [Microbacterium agarici]TQO22888.1 GntR family transcriptional regulator [Microbacterium agarici]
MPTPLYQKIRTEIEERIQSGELAPGAKVPTEAELQSAHGVSRSVAQRALNDLAQAGLVVRHKRLGTHVAEGARQVNLLRSVGPKVGSAGIPGRLSVVSAEVVPAHMAEVELPGIDEDEPVIQLIRVRHDLDDTPVVVEVAAVPFQLSPQLLNENLETFAILEHFAAIGVSVARSRMYFDALLLENTHAELLGIDPGVAILRRRRHMWQPNGQIAESTAYYLRPGFIDLYLEYTDQG